MSLKNRIPVLFIGFAILPTLLLGVGDYLQSVQALRTVIDARREALAGQTARDVERSYERSREMLQAIGVRLADSAPGEPVELELSPSIPFDSIRVLGQTGQPSTVWAPGSRREPTRCGSAPEPVVIRVDQGGGSGITVEGFLDFDALGVLAPTLTSRIGHDGHTRVVDRATGAVLYDSGCLETAPVAEVAGAAQTVAGLTLASEPGPSGDPDELRQSSARVGQPDWLVVVYSSDQEFIAPFQRSRLLYVALVLLVLMAAAGVFSVLAQGSLGSLPALIKAADEVQVGNMRPWLPPPGDDDVGRLAMAFRKMTDRLDESIRQSQLNQKLAAVGELASYLSHEIRNPLSSIRLGLQTLHRDLSSGFIPPDASRIIEISLNEVKRLDGVVRTVLEVGRERGEIDGETTCDVHGTITGAVDVITPKARSKGVEIEVRPMADRSLVMGDQEALRGVWLNLIVNALDAVDGREDARIVISTRSVGDEEVHVRVADNGPGVPRYALDSIFEPFFTTKDEGNGIGLATASATIQAAGGSITYDEQASVDGAVFLIRLRVAHTDMKQGLEPIREPKPAAPVAGAA